MEICEYGICSWVSSHPPPTWLDSIYIHRINSSTHFVSINISYSVEDYDKLYLRKWWSCIDWHCPLSLIVVLNSLLSLENISKMVLVLVLSIVQHFFPKAMGNLSVLSRLWRLCWEIFLLNSRVIRMIIYLRLNLHITIVITEVLTFVHLSHCMVESIDLS